MTAMEKWLYRNDHMTSIKDDIWNNQYTMELMKFSKDNFVNYNLLSKEIKISGNITKLLSKTYKMELSLCEKVILDRIIDTGYSHLIDYWKERVKIKEEIHSEFMVKNISNTDLWISLNMVPLINEQGILEAYCGYIHDITKEKEIQRELKSLIEFDRITGLPSKHYIKNLIDDYIHESKDDMNTGALFLINIDNFKFINDCFGHEEGDLLLKKVSQLLMKYISEEDLICRYTADEFLIFSKKNANKDEMKKHLTKIRDIFVRPFIINNSEIYITVSMGVALCPIDGKCFSSLIKSAGSAMFKAKNNGMNQVEFYDGSISIELDRINSIQKGLRNAIHNKELFVVFQPKVMLNSSKVSGFEALLRWKSSSLGFVSPVEFISIAESSRIIIPIGRFILGEVFKKVRELLNEGYDDFKIAVNFSEVQLRYGNILDDFNYFIDLYDVPPRYIEVEITESLLMRAFDENIQKLHRIKELGISVALDDFGTGYSSFNYLTKLPIDVLKIDRSFVKDLENSEKSRFIIETIIKLSHELGIDVVAEGVESYNQVQYLKKISCDVVQGFYFSQPETFEKIKDLLGKTL